MYFNFTIEHLYMRLGWETNDT